MRTLGRACFGLFLAAAVIAGLWVEPHEMAAGLLGAAQAVRP